MKTLLIAPSLLKLEKIVLRSEAIVLIVNTMQPMSCCPRCQSPSLKVHSRYQRRVADLPWESIAVRLELHTRKFFCRNQDCPQRIFCEPLPEVVARYARQTTRLHQALALIGLALGGEAGARAALGLGFSTSPDTLLHRIRQAAKQRVERQPVKVLGVDDFAFRRGQRYGTILVDQERHCVIELLPDREAQTLTNWLTQHPEVEIVTRDRAQAYAEGIRQGAPQAIQVADRWHLLRNLTEALERWLGRKRRYLKQAAEVLAADTQAETQSATTSSPPLPTRKQMVRDERRAERLARYQEVRELSRQGASIQSLAHHFGMHRRLVRLFIRADEYPERATPRKRPSKLDRYLPYLRRRWEEGCHNAMELYREIKAQGFHGAASVVRRVISQWRRQLPPHLRCARRLRSGSPPIKITVPSPRSATWLLVRADEELEEDDRALREKLMEVCPETRAARDLAQRFQQLVSARQVEAFDQWLNDAAQSRLPELQNFAAGLRKDPAVRAALEQPWSNGQVEGQVNRLKMIKRTMYGRANLDLLRARVLHAP